MNVWVDETATTKKKKKLIEQDADSSHILTWDDIPHLPQTITPSVCVLAAPQ